MTESERLIWCQHCKDGHRTPPCTRANCQHRNPVTMATTCRVGGCEKPRGRQGLCGSHRARLERYGDVHVDKRAENRAKPIAGYRVEVSKGHVLADSKGRVYQHRLVLFNAIGDGTHPCYWCATPVTWCVDLVVDHLDAVKTHNAPENLVASCHPCNVRRGLSWRWHGSDDFFLASLATAVRP